MIVLEVNQEKITQLFEDNFDLDIQPLKSYVYFDDSAPSSLKVLTQISGSTNFREWNSRDGKILGRTDIYKDFALKMYLIKTPGDNVVPTKLVVLAN